MSESAVRVVVDPGEAKRGVSQAEQALRRLSNTIGDVDNRLRGLDKGIGGVGKAATTADRAFVRTGASARQMANGLAAANDNAVRGSGSLLRMAASAVKATLAIAGLSLLVGGITGLVTAFTKASDAMSAMEAKVRIAIGSQGNLAAAMKEVRDIADSTRSGVAEVGQLYAKMAQNARNLGISQVQVGTATKTFAMILKVGGATAQEAASSILQLGQAMGSGLLQGDEFKSLAENSSLFLDVLSKSMGVARGELKKLGSEGKITGQQIAKALTDPKIIADIEAKWGLIPVTFADWRTAFANAGMGWAAALMQGFNAGDSMMVMLTKFQNWARSMEPVITNFAAKVKEAFAVVAPIFTGIWSVAGPVLGFLITHLDGVAKAAIVAASGFLTFKAAMAVGSVSAAVKEIIALERAMGATSVMSAGFSAAMKVAQGAVNSLTVSLMANPFVALAVAIVAVGVALYEFSDQIQLGTKGLGTLADAGNVVWGDMKAGLASVGQSMASTWEDTKKWAAGAWESVSANWGPIGDWFAEKLGPLAGWFSSLFGDIEFSFAGLIRFIARGVDNWINFWVNGVTIMGNVWKNLPAIVGAAVTSAANFVITGIENMINRAISGINGLIALANKIPKVNIGALGSVKLGRVSGPANPGIGSLTAGVGRHSYVEGYAESVFDRSDKRAAGRAGSGKKGGASSNAADNGAVAPGAAGGKPAGSGGKGAGSNEKSPAEKYDELIQKMKDELKLAGMLKGEAELYNKELEARKALGADLSEQQKKQVDDLVKQKWLAESMTSMKQEAFDVGNENQLLEQSLASLMSDQQDYAEKLLKYRLEYLNKGGDIANLNTEEWQALEQQLILEWRKNDALRERIALRKEEIDLGKKLFKDAGIPRDGTAERARYDNKAALSALATVVKPEGMSEREFQAQMQAAVENANDELARKLASIADKNTTRVLEGLGMLGDAIGGKLGQAINGIAQAVQNMADVANGKGYGSGIFGGLGKMFGGDPDNPNAFGKAFKEGAAKVFDPLKGTFDKLFGENGTLIKNFGKTLGQMGAGAQIGSAVAGVGKMLWGKFSSTGSQIGGAIGSFAGPIGSIVGSVIGGTIGGLFKKSKKASQSFSFDASGNLVAGTLSGNSSKMKGAAQGAGNSVISGINNIAQALGADLTSIRMASIGIRDGKYRVDYSGNGQTKKKKGAVDFGKDGEAAAVAAVIADSLKKGILTGISDFSQRILRAAGPANLDAQVALAARYEQILRDLVSLEDPITGPLKNLNKEFEKLRKTMVASGATVAELANVDRYYQLQREKLLEDSVSDLKAFQEKLNGPGSGVTGVTRLNRMLTEFAGFEAQIASGKQVDQSKFTDLGSNIFDLAADLYGTATSEFQDIRSRLQAANGGAIQNVTDAIEAQQAVVNAVTDGNAHLIRGNELLATNNDYQRQILEALQSLQAVGKAENLRGGLTYGGVNARNV